MKDVSAQGFGAAGEVYSPVARTLHWLTVAALVFQIPLGFAMVNIDGLPSPLYNFHKLFGMIFLGLILVRLAYRLTHGAPPDEPTLNLFEKVASHTTHWTLYGLLILVPILGWLGISYYDAREVFGLTIPSLAAKDTAFAEKVFSWHKWAAIAVVALAALHVGAAMMHYVVKKDGVLKRMLPAAGRRA